MNGLPKRYQIVKHDTLSAQQTVVRGQGGRPWVGTESAAQTEASRLLALHAAGPEPARWTYEVVEESR